VCALASCSHPAADRPPAADDIIYDHKFAPEDCLGLDHIDKSGKTRTTGEKAIVIRG
jgi:hypothetical protein